MKHILFYALKDDILPILDMVESKGSLQYARMGNYRHDAINGGIAIYGRGAEIPNLGQASADSTAACEAFLVCERETQIELRKVQEDRVCVDQFANPDSVTFTPGGMLNDDVVLHGRVATASDSKVSQDLVKRFNSAIKRTFAKVKAFYVGPKALVLLESGIRLTISAQSPREFDLTSVTTR